MTLQIKNRDAMRFAVDAQSGGEMRVSVTMVVEVRPPSTVIRCSSEPELWTQLVKVALDPKSAVRHGLQIGRAPDRFYTLGLANGSGCTVKTLAKAAFADEAALRSWLAEMAAERHAALAAEAARDALRRP